MWLLIHAGIRVKLSQWKVPQTDVAMDIVGVKGEWTGMGLLN